MLQFSVSSLCGRKMNPLIAFTSQLLFKRKWQGNVTSFFHFPQSTITNCYSRSKRRSHILKSHNHFQGITLCSVFFFKPHGRTDTPHRWGEVFIWILNHIGLNESYNDKPICRIDLFKNIFTSDFTFYSVLTPISFFWNYLRCMVGGKWHDDGCYCIYSFIVVLRFCCFGKTWKVAMVRHNTLSLRVQH